MSYILWRFGTSHPHRTVRLIFPPSTSTSCSSSLARASTHSPLSQQRRTHAHPGMYIPLLVVYHPRLTSRRILDALLRLLSLPTSLRNSAHADSRLEACAIRHMGPVEIGEYIGRFSPSLPPLIRSFPSVCSPSPPHRRRVPPETSFPPSFPLRLETQSSPNYHQSISHCPLDRKYSWLATETRD